MTAKWGFWATHIGQDAVAVLRPMLVTIGCSNWYMRRRKILLSTRPTWTGVFARSAGGGFDADRIYTPQGEWTYLQCMNGPCRPEAVFPARPYLDKILPLIDDDGFIPHDAIPHCPYCGGGLFGNVRGGNAFLHHDVYERQSASLEQWLDSLQQQGKSLVVLENWRRIQHPHRDALSVRSGSPGQEQQLA
jgi:hypothetical protein